METLGRKQSGTQWRKEEMGEKKTKNKNVARVGSKKKHKKDDNEPRKREWTIFWNLPLCFSVERERIDRGAQRDWRT